MSPNDDQARDPLRRTLLRGAAAVGLAAASGAALAGCGGGNDAARAAGAAESAGSAPAIAVPPVPTSGKKPSKSDVYQRTPEPRPARTKEPKAAKSPEAAPSARGGAPTSGAAAEPAASSKGGDLATARKKDGEKAGGRKEKKTATPKPTEEPLPPGALARTSDIPVGGGTIFEAEKVIVTQPTKGTFKGFTTTCTHTGCSIDKVAEGAIICPCHGSRFGLADGAVQKGPATRPLPAEPIAVDPKGNISRG